MLLEAPRLPGWLLRALMLLQAPEEPFGPVRLLRDAEAATGLGLRRGTGRTGDTAPANGATLPCVSSLPAQSHSRRLEGEAEGISLLLKKTCTLLFGFVVSGKSERTFSLGEAEGRGEGVVCIGQRRKKPTAFCGSCFL